jgi:hypothetical protein
VDPFVARGAELILRFEFLRFRRELLEFFGVDQRVAFGTRQRARRKIA